MKPTEYILTCHKLKIANKSFVFKQVLFTSHIHHPLLFEKIFSAALFTQLHRILNNSKLYFTH